MSKRTPLLIRISKALDVDLSLPTNLSDLNNNKLKTFVKDMKETFEEMKKFNAEFDKLMTQMDDFEDDSLDIVGVYGKEAYR